MRIYALGYFEGDTYKVKRVIANTVAEACKKANLDMPIVRTVREEWNTAFLKEFNDFLKRLENESD